MESGANNNGKFAVAGATGRVGRHIVDVLEESGHEVVPISRSNGVDVITGEGLKEALAGVTSLIDVSTGPSPDQEEATKFFTTSTRNLLEAGEEAGVQRITAVSIVGADRFSAGYNAAKIVQEQALLSGPIPVARAARDAVPRVRRGARGVGHAGRRELRAAHADPADRGEKRRGGRRRPGHRPGRVGGADRGDRRPAGGEPCRDGRTCSWPGAASRCGSRPRATRTTRTPACTRRGRRSPVRTPRSRARRTRSGWTPRPEGAERRGHRGGLRWPRRPATPRGAPRYRHRRACTSQRLHGRVQSPRHRSRRP